MSLGREHSHRGWRARWGADRKRSRDADVRDRARALFVSFVDPYVLLQPVFATDGSIEDFEFINVNEQAASLLGRPIPQLLGQRLCEFGDPESIAALVRDYAEVMRTGTPLVRDAEEFPSDAGESQYFAIRAVPTGGYLSVTWRDVTAQVTATARAHESETLLRTVLDTMFDPLVVLVPVRDEHRVVVDFEIAEANNAACVAAGVARDTLTGRRLRSMFPPGDPAADEQVVLLAGVLERSEPLVLDDHRLGIWAEDHHCFDLRVVPVDDMLNVTIRDVTDRHEAALQLAASEERYRLITHNTSDVIAHLREREIVWVSPSAGNAFGGDGGDWIGQLVDDIVDGADIEVLDEGMTRVANGETVVLRLRVRAPGRRTHWVEAHASPYLDANDEPDGVIASLRIIDTEVQALSELARLARVDDLTGLLNRREGLARVEHLHHPSRRMGAHHALLFCDVDSFKEINDNCGHAVGDLVLRTLSHRLMAAVRGDDVVARMGGDEFMVLLAGIDEMSDVLQVAEKIRLVVRVPIATPAGPVTATMSIGPTAALPGESSEAFIARADRAMYEAKASGRDRVVRL